MIAVWHDPVNYFAGFFTFLLRLPYTVADGKVCHLSSSSSPDPSPTLPPVARTRRPTMEDPMSMFVRTALIAVLGLNVYAMSSLAQDNKEKPKLEGQHQIIAGERDGKPLAATDIKGYTFRFTGDKVMGASKDGTEFLAADYTLDPAKKPCVIVMKLTSGSDKGKELKGLVERNGDTIRVDLRWTRRRGSDRIQDQAKPGDVYTEGGKVIRRKSNRE